MKSPYRCFFLRRKFVRYLEADVPPREAERLEKHLAGCRDCGELLERLRSGHEAGRQFGRLGPETGCRPPEFEEIWAVAGASPGRRVRLPRPVGPIIQGLSSPLAIRILLALVLTQSVLLVVSNWKAIGRPRAGTFAARDVRELRDYTPLNIGEFSSNSRYQIVTEGFVQSVYFDEEERTLHIKLVEVPQKPEPFVICEIRNITGMTIPREGSRVRVYGTARYDAQPGRGWHEVNPVMDIAVLKR